MISAAVRNKSSFRLFYSLFRFHSTPVQESKESKIEPLVPYEFYDIAANLSDERFQGRYYGKQVHESDFESVVKRAQLYGVKKMLFAAGYIEDAVTSYNLALKGPHFYSTIGVHPCRAKHCFENVEEYFLEIRKTIEGFKQKGKLAAIGECGLDYDRFDYASKEEQLK